MARTTILMYRLLLIIVIGLTIYGCDRNRNSYSIMEKDSIDEISTHLNTNDVSKALSIINNLSRYPNNTKAIAILKSLWNGSEDTQSKIYLENVGVRLSLAQSLYESTKDEPYASYIMKIATDRLHKRQLSGITALSSIRTRSTVDLLAKLVQQSRTARASILSLSSISSSEEYALHTLRKLSSCKNMGTRNCNLLKEELKKLDERPATTKNIDPEFDKISMIIKDSFYNRRFNEAIKLLKPYAKSDSKAQYYLASAYEQVGKHREAFKWMSMAVKNKTPDSKIQLAKYYYNGKGTPKSISKAITLLEEELAIRENEEASFLLRIYRKNHDSL